MSKEQDIHNINRRIEIVAQKVALLESKKPVVWILFKALVEGVVDGFEQLACLSWADVRPFALRFILVCIVIKGGWFLWSLFFEELKELTIW